jgi:hypothetical protein
MKKQLIVGLFSAVLATSSFAYEIGDKYKLTEADKTKAVATLKDSLKDPYSAKWGDVKLSPRGEEVSAGVNGSKVIGICVKSNSKNGFGAYTGMKYSLIQKNVDTGKYIVLFADSTGDMICSMPLS